MVDDTISRQMAIDIVWHECGELKGLAKEIVKQFNGLPSAQPVLTCKRCKYDGYYKHNQCRNCLRKERDLYEPE